MGVVLRYVLVSMATFTYREAINIAEDLKVCVTELGQEEDGFPSIPTELMDHNVARIFSKSRRGKVRLGRREGKWGDGRS